MTAQSTPVFINTSGQNTEVSNKPANDASDANIPDAAKPTSEKDSVNNIAPADNKPVTDTVTILVKAPDESTSDEDQPLDTSCRRQQFERAKASLDAIAAKGPPVLRGRKQQSRVVREWLER